MLGRFGFPRLFCAGCWEEVDSGLESQILSHLIKSVLFPGLETLATVIRNALRIEKCKKTYKAFPLMVSNINVF
jgi:hypothetical protein